MRRSFTVVALAALVGCTGSFDEPYHWNTEQVNDVNRAAQVVDWRDLVQGHADPGSDGLEAAAAVDRLRRGLVKPLPTATVSDIATQGSAVPAAAPVTTGAVAN